jgi:hypothetical protein
MHPCCRPRRPRTHQPTDPPTNAANATRLRPPQEIFKLTVKAIQGDEEDVSLQAVEFWSTLCDYELELEEEGEDADEVGGKYSVQ